MLFCMRSEWKIVAQWGLRGLTRSAAAEAAAGYGKCVKNALVSVTQPA